MMEADRQGWIEVDNAMLQQRLGLSVYQVSSAIKALEQAGWVEKLREGNRFIGLRLLPGPVAPSIPPVAPEPEPDAPAEAGASPRMLEELRIPATPLLDAYVAAREAAAANPNWLRFEPDPLAEEALVLRRAVVSLYLDRYK